MPETIQFTKYHGLGNDYLVIRPESLPLELNPDLVRYICDRHYGVGSDGILLGPLPSVLADFGLHIYNPDGTPAEKSGNGLRIFARFLWETGQVGANAFEIETPGGVVCCHVFDAGKTVRVEIGRPGFYSQDIPVSGAEREVVGEIWTIAGQAVRLCALTFGNPHCVLFDQPVSAEFARKFGPLVENDERFPQRTNVQFLEVIDRNHLRIEIWERGAGYTLASGTSACAAASAAFRLGCCAPDLVVHMPGGELQVEIAADRMVTLTGPVTHVCQGALDLEGFASFCGAQVARSV